MKNTKWLKLMTKFPFIYYAIKRNEGSFHSPPPHFLLCYFYTLRYRMLMFFFKTTIPIVFMLLVENCEGSLTFSPSTLFVCLEYIILRENSVLNILCQVSMEWTVVFCSKWSGVRVHTCAHTHTPFQENFNLL